MDGLSKLAFLLDLYAIRREREALEAKVTCLADICAKTDQILDDTKIRIERSLAALEHSPSIVPDPQPYLTPPLRHRGQAAAQ